MGQFGGRKGNALFMVFERHFEGILTSQDDIIVICVVVALEISLVYDRFMFMI